MRSNQLVSTARSVQLDERNATAAAKGRASSEELLGRSLRASAVRERWRGERPTAVVLAGILLTSWQALILGLVHTHILEGAPAIEVSGEEIGDIIGCGKSTVWVAVLVLRALGLLVRVRTSVDASQSRIGGPYICRDGRSFRSNDPTAYTRSVTKNLYTLGVLALALGLGRPRKPPAPSVRLTACPVDKPEEKVIWTATSLSLFSDSGSGPQRSDSDLGPVKMWTTRPSSVAAEAETSAPGASLRSVEKESLRHDDSLRSPSRLRESMEASPPAPPDPRAAPFVAGNENAPPARSGGDAEAEASMRGSGLRGLWEELGRLLRHLHAGGGA